MSDKRINCHITKCEYCGEYITNRKDGLCPTCRRSSCTWKYDSYFNCWDTECNYEARFIWGTPEDNEYEFCPFCGKKIKVIGE